jgi:hypothetical protein
LQSNGNTIVTESGGNANSNRSPVQKPKEQTLIGPAEAPV